MNDSWDLEFDGDLKVPDSVRSVSDKVKSATEAARNLEERIVELKRVLPEYIARNPTVPDNLEQSLRQGCLLVAASVEEDDEFLASQTYQRFKPTEAVNPHSIEEALSLAVSILEKIKD